MRTSTLIPVLLVAASAAPALAAPIRGDYDSLMAREDYSDLYEREYFDDYYVREDAADAGASGDASGSGSAPGAEPAAPAATKASTNSNDAGSDPAKTPSASQPTSTAAAPAQSKPANHYSPNITMSGHGIMSDLGNGLFKFLFGRSDDAEVLERSVEDEELFARDFDEELFERDLDEDLYAREFDDELWAREFDDELWAREGEEVHPHHHHQHIPPQANLPTQADRKELGVFPHHGAEQHEAVAHQHNHHHSNGAQQPMQGLTPKREFIDELRGRMDYFDELD